MILCVFGHVSYIIGGSPEVIIGIVMCHAHSARVMGKKFFHSRCINWSYRNRGYEARTHRNPMDSITAFVISESENSSGIFNILGLKNIIVVSVFIIRMLVYSAKKNRANGPAEYSTL